MVRRWQPKERRARRRSWAKWAQEHRFSSCHWCGEIPGVAQRRYERIKDAQLRAGPEAVPYLVLPLKRARDWLRARGVNPDLPFAIADHVIPLWEGGADDEENVKVICQPCHKEKTAEESARRSRAIRK